MCRIVIAARSLHIMRIDEEDAPVLEAREVPFAVATVLRARRQVQHQLRPDRTEQPAYGPGDDQ